MISITKRDESFLKRIFLRKFYNFYELKKERKPIGKICYVVVSLRERRLEKGSVSPMNGEERRGSGKIPESKTREEKRGQFVCMEP